MLQARPADMGAAERGALRATLAALAGAAVSAVAITGVRAVAAKAGAGGLLVSLAVALGGDPAAGRRLAAQLRVRLLPCETSHCDGLS